MSKLQRRQRCARIVSNFSDFCRVHDENRATSPTERRLESLGVVQRWLHAHLHEFAKQVQDAWMLPSWSTYDLSTFPVHHSSLDVASWLARMEQSYPLAVPRPDSESFAWSELGA